MKKLLINIWDYSQHAKFEILANDNASDVENDNLDKLGEKDIVWENLGINYDNKINRITFEEVIHDTRPIQTKKVLGFELGAGAS